LKEEIEINQFKKEKNKNELVLTFKTNDFGHESKVNSKKSKS